MVSLHHSFQPESFTTLLANKILRPAVGMAAAAFALDRGVGLLDKHRRTDQASIIANETDQDHIIYTLPGCRTDGHLVAGMMQPQLQTVGDTAFVAYPKKGFALESIKEQLLLSRQRNSEKAASFYAVSMGGLVLSKLLSDQQFVDNFGGIDKIVFDSSPSRLQDIRRPTRMALGYAGLFYDSWTMEQVANIVMTRRCAYSLDHEDCVTDEMVLQHVRSSARAPLQMTKSQGRFIKNHHLELDVDAAVADQIYYLHSPYDSVVDTDTAYGRYNQRYREKIIDITDHTRPHGSHASGPEHQRKVVELFNPNYQHAPLPVAV